MNCPNCQTRNPDTSKFCSNCGTSLEPVRSIKGERRLVTVLFADVVGSTSMAEQLDPEQVTDIMNGAFSFMNDAVGKYEGTVARLMGDAIMAFFGAPIAHENDAERAIRAGLDIRDAAQDYARWIQRQFGLEFNVRVGINTGLVVVATVGDELRSEHTVMGDTVNVAARMQQIAEPGSVFISSETMRLANHAFDIESRGSFDLKGKAQPVQAYEVRALKFIPGQGRGLAGITSPLVGREREMYLLVERLEDVQVGQGSLISVIGEAGLGKSRLIAELRRTVVNGAGPETRWLEGRALSYGQATPFYPWREVLLQGIGADAVDSPESVRRKLHDHGEQFGITRDQLRFLEVILTVESVDSREQIAELDGDVLQRSLSDSVRAIISAMARQTPLVLVFDDLHWTDAGSLDLMLPVSELVSDHAVMLVLVLRPDRNSPSWSFVDQITERLGDRYTQIGLEPLDGEHSVELLGNLLYVEDLPTNIRDLILKKSEGNPFFLEEVIRDLIDSGHIVRQNGHWRATSEIVNVTVPDTLVGVLSSRIDRLPAETKSVAQLAATIGRIFTYQVLKAVCEAAPESERIEDPSPHLARLSEEELVRERARHPELEYIFKHVLTQEAAYNLLLVRTRRDYHRRTGAVLEELNADRLDEMAATLAHHFWEGEDWPRAIEYSLKAGIRAEKQFYALREAHEHFEHAYQALEHMPDATPQRVVEIVLAGMTAGTKFLPREEVLERLDRIERIAREAGDKRSLSQILHWIAHVHVLSGYTSRAMPALLENYELSEELGDQRLSLYPSWSMAFEMLNRAPREATAKLIEIAGRAHQYQNRHLEMHALGGAAVGYARVGEFDKARTYLERAKFVADQADHPITEADYHLLAAFAYLDTGEYALSLEHGRIGLEKSLESGLMECVGAGYCLVGMGNLQTRNAADALTTFQESLQYAEDFRGDLQVVNQVDAGMAIARYVTGETSELDEVEAALASSESIDDKYMVAEIALTLAEAYLGQGKLNLAEKHLGTALDYYREHGMRPHLVRALEVQVKLFEERGAPEHAEETRAEIAALSTSLEAGEASPESDPDAEFWSAAESSD